MTTFAGFGSRLGRHPAVQPSVNGSGRSGLKGPRTVLSHHPVEPLRPSPALSRVSGLVASLLHISQKFEVASRATTSGTLGIALIMLPTGGPKIRAGGPLRDQNFQDSRHRIRSTRPISATATRGQQGRCPVHPYSQADGYHLKGALQAIHDSSLSENFILGDIRNRASHLGTISAFLHASVLPYLPTHSSRNNPNNRMRQAVVPEANCCQGR